MACRARRRANTHSCALTGLVLQGRMTLLLGPPAGGKSTLLQLLSGLLTKSATNMEVCRQSWITEVNAPASHLRFLDSCMNVQVINPHEG